MIKSLLYHIANRVVINGYVINNIPYWSTGEVIDGGTFCENTPDQGDQPNIYLFFAHESEVDCKSSTNRLDDSPCDTDSLRICMKQDITFFA